MRQFLLGGNVAYTTATALNSVAAGAVGVFYNDNGELKVSADGVAIKEKAMLVLGRTAANGGPVVIPIHKHLFKMVKGVYKAATTFVGTVTIPAPTAVGTYSIVIAKKGVGFNERNKYTASVYVDSTSMTAATLAQKLTDVLNKNSIASGVSATVATAVITITASSKGEDYAIVPSDKLSSVVPTVTTKGELAYGDAKYVEDLASKAAADAGIEYTYSDGTRELNPKYPLNALASANATDVGFTIFTLSFAEPRDVDTVGENIRQIVQVAFPTGAAQIADFETVTKAIAGIA